MGPPSADAPIGPVKRFGRYTLVKKLATGGMAEIWLARQRGLAGFNRFVVIKKILSHLSEQRTFVEMFLDEARTSAQLNHPNVVQIYDLGREGDAYFIAMEYIAGENLAAVAWRGMKRHRPVPPAYAARVIADACKALHYAHHLRGANGQPLEIVHRDISPQNVLVTYDGEIKIVDFGIAKAATKSEQTKTGMLKGKFSYMSPEQCLGAPVDMRSDIFALGILLYELCTGKRLFKHESELMILEMITKRTVVPPSQVAEGIPAKLDQIIMTALSKNADQRYQTAQDMQHALEGFLREQSTAATSVELGAYVRSLFTDKIDEKRRLVEMASRDDFEDRYAEEPTEDHRPRRTVQGLPPSQVVVQGVPTGTYLPQATLPPSGTGSPLPAQSSNQATYGTYGTAAGTGVVAENSWITRFVIVLALAIIAGASVVLYTYRQPLQALTPLDPGTPDRAPLQTGSLSLESSPSGAAISLDGKAMMLGDQTQAKTPADLSPLRYGQAYRIGLALANHEPFEQEIVMGEDWDGETIRPELIPLPGVLVAKVDSDEANQVRVFFAKEEVGRGPKVRRTYPGDAGSVAVRAELPGHTCRAEPSAARILPNQTVQVRIRCHEPRVASRRPSRPMERRTEPAPRRAPPSPGQPPGCTTDPNLPSGFLTIDTTPPSEIFYDDRRIGETPLPRYPLPAGCVVLRAKSGETKKTFQVRIEPNRVAVYRLSLAE